MVNFQDGVLWIVEEKIASSWALQTCRHCSPVVFMVTGSRNMTCGLALGSGKGNVGARATRSYSGSGTELLFSSFHIRIFGFSHSCCFHFKVYHCCVRLSNYFPCCVEHIFDIGIVFYCIFSMLLTIIEQKNSTVRAHRSHCCAVMRSFVFQHVMSIFAYSLLKKAFCRAVKEYSSHSLASWRRCHRSGFNTWLQNTRRVLGLAANRKMAMLKPSTHGYRIREECCS